MSKTRRYVLCVSNDGYPASLEARKVYLALADPAADRRGMLRVVDESGEDYVFPRDRFVEVTLPPKAETLFGVRRHRASSSPRVTRRK